MKMPPWTILLAILLGYVCCKIVYRLTLHPLAKYPGPFLAKVTSLYSAYRGWHGDIHLDIVRCHSKYGVFVRYGPNRLMVNTSRGLHDVYGYGKNVRKSKSYLSMVPDKHAWSILTLIDKKTHLERRKVMSKALSDTALKSFEPEMLNHMDVFHEQVAVAEDSEGWSAPKNMSVLCMRLTFDIMCEFGFGQKTSLQTDRTLDFIPEVLKNYSWRMGIYEQYPKLARLNAEGFARILRIGNDLRDKFEEWSDRFSEVVMNRQDGLPKGQFGLIRDLKTSNGSFLPHEELLAEGSFLILAGSETTAITMSALFFYLANNQSIYDKLASEIRSTFSDISEVTSGEKLLSCSYLSACVTETLRICPPVPGIPWREVEDGGAIVDNHYITTGLNVGASMYSLHHNETYFPSPYKFDPSRWLDAEGTEKQKSLAYTAFNPFSLGPRGCAGRSMALLELNLLVARTLFCFDFRLASGRLATVGRGHSDKGGLRSRENEFQLFANITSYCEGPWIVFKRRGVAG
ncbi:hypothetical protein HYALB_00000477 [Hymenoscyphus albidus]|uniref:Benzoate 4-monooxygenase cytochrome P450 n=1 Tax=Hymenoscyphus albidus TaxID=595503 RepID=A0A9N9LL01_9HELO|nr:hypothetical protein HYALB_00000477 [Hymenoscyphus albidus]